VSSQFFPMKIFCETDKATESTLSKRTKAGVLQPVTLNGEMKRLDKKLRLKRSKREVGMPKLKHQASKMSLLPLAMVFLSLPMPLPTVVLQTSPSSPLSRKTPTSHTPTTLLSKPLRKWPLLVSGSLVKPMRAQSKTRNGRMPKS
jgi:hypothetical protein